MNKKAFKYFYIKAEKETFSLIIQAFKTIGFETNHLKPTGYIVSQFDDTIGNDPNRPRCLRRMWLNDLLETANKIRNENEKVA